MPKVSNAVQDRVKELYAVLATVAAEKALRKVEFDEPTEAEAWAKYVEKWLARAGAHCACRTYEKPRP
jgi:hypothetical protein